MLDLLTKYSVEEILIFIVMLALAIKGCISFYDWGKERLEKSFGRKNNIKDEHNKIYEEINKNKDNVNQLAKNQEDMKNQLNKMMESINLLISSDKDDIKSWITEKHHYFCYQKQSIDDYSLDCMEKRFKHYTEENGNSFVADLMEDVRNLPINNDLMK